MSTTTVAADAVEGTAEEIPDSTPSPTAAISQQLVQRQATGTLAVTPQAEATELVARLDVIRDAMENAMQEGVDYGRIPGIDKPTLFKPGAEKLGVLFQLDIQVDNQKTWGPDDHLTVNSQATVYHAPTRTRLGFGEGICSTREKKYATRRQERTCPACNSTAVIKSKAEYGGGWLCFKKKDGCGAKFPDGDPQIEGQQVGEVDNPDLPDLWNTVIKMGSKRARVDAVLAVTGASALFTQDAEDLAQAAADREPPAPAGPPFGEAANAVTLASARRALAFLLGTDEIHQSVADVLSKMEKDGGGYLPRIAARAALHIAATVKGQATETKPAAEQEAIPEPTPDEIAEARDRPGAGTVTAPEPINDPIKMSAALRQAGCICTNPAAAMTDEGARDDNCPIYGHGIAF